MKTLNLWNSISVSLWEDYLYFEYKWRKVCKQEIELSQKKVKQLIDFISSRLKMI